MTTKLFTANNVATRHSDVREIIGAPQDAPLRVYVQARGKREALRILASLGEIDLRSTDLEESTPRRSDDFQRELTRQYLPPAEVAYYAAPGPSLPVAQVRLVGRAGIPTVDIAGRWRRVVSGSRHHVAFEKAGAAVTLPDLTDSDVLAALERALAGNGLAIVPATCTCLHPGWPEAKCLLHPEARPLSREEGAEFARRFDERVEACHAARTPDQQRMYAQKSTPHQPAPSTDTGHQDWMSEDELAAVVDRAVAGAGAQAPLGQVMKVVTAEVAGRQDPKVIYRMVKDRLG